MSITEKKKKIKLELSEESWEELIYEEEEELNSLKKYLQWQLDQVTNQNVTDIDEICNENQTDLFNQ